MPRQLSHAYSIGKSDTPLFGTRGTCTNKFVARSTKMRHRTTNKKTKKLRKKSLELQAFVKHSSELHEVLNDGVLTRLAWDLFQAEIFSQATRTNITHVMLSESDKATKLVGAIIQSIKSDNSNLLTILDCCDKYLELKPVVMRMREEYDHLKDVSPGFKNGT